jgi:type I restriction enzyme S subunit
MNRNGAQARVPLREAFWFQEGPGVRKWQFTNSGIKLLNVANIEKGGTLNLQKSERYLSGEEVKKKYSHFLIDPGDLVVASSGISFDDDGLLRTRGAFVEQKHVPLCLNTSTIRFKAIKNVSDLRFLRFWLDSREFRSQVTKLVTGIAQQNFGPSHLKAIQITLPSLTEQRRIAGILDKAEALRAKRRVALSKIDILPQAVFLELFGDPFSNPRGWPVFPLSDISEATQGVQIPRDAQREEATEGYERYLYINDFYSDGNPKYVPNRYPTKRVTRENLIMANTGSPGRVFKGRPGILSNNLFKITFDTTKISTVFFYHFLASDFFQHHLQAQMKQGIQSHLGHKTFGAQKLPLPPIELQCEFARRVSAVEKLKAAHRASLAKLEALFASLQHGAFRGEL